MCALSYFTTPSSPISKGPVPLTGMIEWAATPGSMGMIESVLMNGVRGDLLSAAVAHLEGRGALDGDDRVGRHPRVDGDDRERLDERVARGHVVRRRGQAA